MDRRDFLKYSLATGVLIWAGSEIPQRLGLGQSAAEALFAVPAANAATPVFPQSVASGDPQPQGITLWTRVGTPATGTIRVAFEVAHNPEFSQVVLRGVAETDASKDYTVKVQLNSQQLRPATPYFYRFIYNQTSSRAGRFKTLPAPNAAVGRARFAFISCQDYTNGYYNAYRFLAQENLDFVVFLGDYIYETVGDTSFQNGVRPLQLPSGQPAAATLEDYRYLYQAYNADPDLQRLRESTAFITIWDDHEFANDSFRENAPDQVPFFKPALRQLANQVWAEHTPTSVPFDASKGPLASVQIYRSFKIGNLMDLVVTDERLYRDGPPCDNPAQQGGQYISALRSLTPNCAGRFAPNRTMLGTEQRQWFLNQILNSTSVWKVWGNEVMTMQLKVLSAFATQLLGQPTPDLFVTLDQWDGYPEERAAIFRAVRQAGVKNFVTITGDLHTFLAGYQKINFDNPADPPVGVEFVVGSTTSSNFAEQTLPGPQLPIQVVTQVLRASNPHIQYFNSTTHGYCVVDVTTDALVCTMKAVSTITQPGGNLSVLKVFRVPRNQTVIQDRT